jgi:hypothetical protein
MFNKYKRWKIDERREAQIELLTTTTTTTATTTTTTTTTTNNKATRY